jgi:hypothetical protein
MKRLIKILDLFKLVPDKQLHFSWGDNIAFIVMCVLMLVPTTLRLWEICLLGVIAAVFAGIAKEIKDAWEKDNKPDYKDAIATSLGGVWAVIKILFLCFLLQ